ncbi:MAG: acylphosphatase [Epsilonproteobacteria bacterium]|nr:acylphosphatase [Campylobacterota bacterium]
METYKFNVSGKVQGVFYRKTIQQMGALGQLRGYVKNLPDGNVEVVADLHDDQLKEFIMVLKNGSPASKVEDVTYSIITQSEDDLLYDGFEIRY